MQWRLHRAKWVAYRASWLWLTLILLSLTAWLGWQNELGRLDRTFYDHIIASHSRDVNPNIVIIAIDERSLALLGPHPWRRNLHAELLRRITEDRPKAVGLNLILNTPDLQYPNHDLELAEAIRENGRVVLPMRMDGGYNGDALTQILPLPLFSEAAAAVGNIHLTSEFDGIVRSVSLRDRIGAIVWERFAIKMLKVGGDQQALAHFPGVNPPAYGINKPEMWINDQRMQIPFAGPPGKVTRVSYIDVLHNQIAPGTFHNKYVLVGTTALGMGGDIYPTPVSTGGNAMSSVEISANIMDALLKGVTIEPVTPLANALFSILPVACLLFSLMWLSPRHALLFCLLLMVVTVGASYLIVRIGGYWYPPAAAIFGLIITYPLWCWQRLEVALAYLSEEFDRLNRESKIFPSLLLNATNGDILDQRIAALTHAAQHLRDLRRLILDSMESLPDATLVTGADGKVVLTNHCAAEYFGVSGVDALYGKELMHLLATIQPVTAQAVCDPQHGLPSMQSSEGVEAVDERGNEFLVKCVPCSNGDNRQVGWIVSLIDITSLRHAERKRDEVLRFLSHDMRAPQTSILALLDLYREDSSVMGQDELFERLGKCARKTLNLADDFIQLDRAESHQYYFEEADLSQLMLDAIDDCWASAHAKNVRTHSDIPPYPSLVKVDRILLTRAIYNLLGNAIKYGPANSEVWCTIAPYEVDGQQFWQITIRDQGPGIPEKDHPYVFKRYQRFHTNTQPTVEGTGLGLVFVKTVLTHHGGKVGFKSTGGQGSEFYIYVPALDLELPPIEE